jgi:MFS transporter, SP family, galactose:H+ symporter
VGLCKFRSPALGALTKPASDGVLSESEAASFTAAATLAAAAGSLLGGPLADRYGRKRALMLTMIACACGFAAIAAGRGYNELLFGRLLTGVAIGGVSVATPLYLSEVSPSHLRGSLGSTMQLSIVSGLLLVYVIGNGTISDKGSWRYLAWIGAVIPTAFVLVVRKARAYLLRCHFIPK